MFKKKLLEIWNHFGKKNQIDKIREEVEELIEAIESGDVTEIENEFADVQVLLKQVYVAHNLSLTNINNIIDSKVTRTLKCIATGDYEKARRSV